MSYSLLNILRKPSFLSQLVRDVLPLELHEYTDQTSAAIVLLVWIGISVAIVRLSRKTTDAQYYDSPTNNKMHTMTTRSHSPRTHDGEYSAPHSSSSSSSPNRITPTTYEVSEANIIKEEPEEETRATRSARKLLLGVPLPSIGSPARLSARSIKTPERFSPGGKMLATDKALRPRAHRSGVAKSINFNVSSSSSDN